MKKKPCDKKTKKSWFKIENKPIITYISRWFFKKALVQQIYDRFVVSFNAWTNLKDNAQVKEWLSTIIKIKLLLSFYSSFSRKETKNTHKKLHTSVNGLTM